MKKVFFFFMAILAPVFSQGIDNQSLVIGMTSGYAPYVSLNAEGAYEGFDIDLGKALSEKLNRKAVFKDLGCMPTLMLALKQNKVDVLIWAISITAERQRVLTMVYYQGKMETTTPFLFWEKVPPGINSIEDLAGKVVAVETGSYQEGILKAFPAVRIKYVDKAMDAVMEIKYGKSFTTTIDSGLLPRLMEQFPAIKVVDLPLPLEQRSLGNGIAINKENVVLAEEIKAAIAALTAEGKIAELEKKWGLVS